MKFRWTAAIALASTIGAGSVWAQTSAARQPPVELPIGIDPRDTLLPGQRQPAPIFGQPNEAGRSTPDTPKTPTAPPPQPTVPAREPAATSPPRLPEEEPQALPTDPTVPRSVLPPLPAERGFVPPPPSYVPGGMQGPAAFAPESGLPVIGPGWGTRSIPVYSPFGPALAAPTYGVSPVMPPRDECGDTCSGCAGCCRDRCCCEPCFFGAVGGLIMGRNDPNRAWLTAQKSDYFNQLMNGADAAAPWTGGWEATIGWFAPTCGALQFTYWGLAPTTGFDYVRMPGDLVTPINLNDVNIGGVGADYFYDNAQEHRAWRYDEINNIELNFLGLPTSRPGGSVQISWLAGVRYFRFRDRLVFGAVHQGFEFGSDGGVNEAYLDSAVANNLIGGQVGAFVDWMLGPRWGVFLFPRVGVFANNINQHFQLYRGDGLRSIDIGTQKTVGSLLGQIDLGVNYFFTPNWSVYVGYRVMMAGGMGLADAQIPAFLVDTQEIQAIESNGDLILQGATAGILWRF